MLLALPCSLVTGQHGLHRGFVFLSCWVDLTQDEREAEEETATSPISVLSGVRALGFLTLAALIGLQLGYQGNQGSRQKGKGVLQVP